MRNIILTYFIVLIAQFSIAQTDSTSTKYKVFHPTRVWIAGGGQALLWAGTFVALDKAWYASYPKQRPKCPNGFSVYKRAGRIYH